MYYFRHHLDPASTFTCITSKLYWKVAYGDKTEMFTAEIKGPLVSDVIFVIKLIIPHFNCHERNVPRGKGDFSFKCLLTMGFRSTNSRNFTSWPFPWHEFQFVYRKKSEGKVEKSISQKLTTIESLWFFYFEFPFNMHTMIQQKTVFENNIIALGKTIPWFHAFLSSISFWFSQICKLKKNVVELKLKKKCSVLFYTM